MNTFKNNSVSKVVGVALVSLLVLPYMTYAQQAVESNPNLGEACGLDIALVLDVSGSIDGTELTQERDAAKAFVNAFLPSTPTLIGLVQFDSSASIVQDLTNNATDLNSDIDSVSGGGLTNWQDAILKATDILEGGLDRDDSQNPDLIVFFSDGDPTTSNGGDPLDQGMVAANAAKTSSASMPIRILGVGIGGDVTVDNFKQITDGAGSIVSPPDAVSINTDIVLSDFTTLANDLGTLAAALCQNGGGDGELKISVKNENGAYVKNSVGSSANTGGNSADGGSAGSAGTGGSVQSSDDDNVGGNGGNGGNGGEGGYIETGSAGSGVSIANVINSNITRATIGCGCEGNTVIKVRNSNGATVKNYVGSGANSGDNNTDGGSAGQGGSGGNVQSSDDGNTGGSGGRSGNGGLGGAILSGPAISVVDIANTINTNSTRIRR